MVIGLIPNRMEGNTCLRRYKFLLIVLVLFMFMEMRVWQWDDVASKGYISPTILSYSDNSATTTSKKATINKTSLPRPLLKFLTSRLPKFLEEYKNPCWYDVEWGRKQLSCVPYYYLIGTAKCGTSSLCSQIRKHPQLAKNIKKENMWIARGQFEGRKELAPLSQYVNIFRAGIDELLRTNVDGYHRKVFGDCSPATIWDNLYYKLMPVTPDSGIIPEPIFTNADYIYHFNPASKILAIIRNPIDRLFSGYMFFKRSSYSLEGFDAYARDLVKGHHHCLEKNTLRACVYTNRGVWRSYGRHRLGFYHVHLTDFLRVFPRKQILVIRLEDYSHDVLHTMRKVFSFLELDPLSDETIIENMNNTKNNTMKPEKKKLGAMWNSTRTLLYDFYKPYNEKLVELLGPEYNYN